MATYEVQAVRERGVWQVFIEGTPITEVLRWSSVGPVAREFLAMDRTTTCASASSGATSTSTTDPTASDARGPHATCQTNPSCALDGYAAAMRNTASRRVSGEHARLSRANPRPCDPNPRPEFSAT